MGTVYSLITLNKEGTLTGCGFVSRGYISGNQSNEVRVIPPGGLGPGQAL